MRLKHSSKTNAGWPPDRKTNTDNGNKEKGDIMYLRRSSAALLRNAVQNSVPIAWILGATLGAAREGKMAPDFL
jgi:hypothetical protein